jgi:putative oxidoreductase
MRATVLFRTFGVLPLPLPADWYAVPLRLMVGPGFFGHGYAKLARGADGFVAILHAIGMPQSYDAAGAHFGQPGYETDLLYAAGLIALCVGGAGPLSLGRYLSGLRP